MNRYISLFLAVLLGISIVWAGLVYAFSDTYPLTYGLDLSGGTELVYEADTSEVPSGEIAGRVEALKTVIERRVNALGVSEPVVYTQTSFTTGASRLVIQLPGVTNPEEAKRQIGKTPYLWFGLVRDESDSRAEPFRAPDGSTPFHFERIPSFDGASIVSASVQYARGVGGAFTNNPVVVVRFNSTGAGIFADVTRENVGVPLVIFIDEDVVSMPVIRTVITGGVTQIEGNFTEMEAKTFADDLSLGALPLPIELEGTSSVSPVLGERTIEQGTFALLVAFGLVSVLFLLVYRSLGVVAIISLIVYATLILIIFKSLGVVFTAAGLVGLGMSLGFAVDANVLICERIREQLAEGRKFKEAIEEGFVHAFTAIRDGNISSFIIAVILYFFSTSLIKGFALTFGLGIIVSMLTGYVLSRFMTRLFAAFIPNPPRLLLPRVDRISPTV